MVIVSAGFKEVGGEGLAIERMLVGLSDLVTHHPQIKELDINPLLVHPEGEGVTVADCRFILQKQGDPS